MSFVETFPGFAAAALALLSAIIHLTLKIKHQTHNQLAVWEAMNQKTKLSNKKWSELK
jgi:hypothetical protein